MSTLSHSTSARSVSSQLHAILSFSTVGEHSIECVAAHFHVNKCQLGGSFPRVECTMSHSCQLPFHSATPSIRHHLQERLETKYSDTSHSDPNTLYIALLAMCQIVEYLSKDLLRLQLCLYFNLWTLVSKIWFAEKHMHLSHFAETSRMLFLENSQ